MQEGLGSQPTAPCSAQGALMSIGAASWQLPKPVVVTDERDSAFPDPSWLKCSQVRRQTEHQLLPPHARLGHTLRFKDEIQVVSALQKLPLLLFSHSVVSNSLQSHRLKHTRLPCPSLSPRVCSNPCPLSW